MFEEPAVEVFLGDDGAGELLVPSEGGVASGAAIEEILQGFEVEFQPGSIEGGQIGARAEAVAELDQEGVGFAAEISVQQAGPFGTEDGGGARVVGPDEAPRRVEKEPAG